MEFFYRNDAPYFQLITQFPNNLYINIYKRISCKSRCIKKNFIVCFHCCEQKVQKCRKGTISVRTKSKQFCRNSMPYRRKCKSKASYFKIKHIAIFPQLSFHNTSGVMYVVSKFQILYEWKLYLKISHQKIIIK